MLSLLSLIIASGTVLRADTEQWEPSTYPNPRLKYAQCNVAEGSTLCDPDHMLTDSWRQTIQESLTNQVERLMEADIPYRAGASEECRSNSTEPPQIYIMLAKRIHTASNQSTTSNDLELFGEGLSQAFGLTNQPCKNYILLLGVEGKTIKVWTGEDLEVNRDQVYSYLNQHMKLFTEKGYMAGLNKCVEELGDSIIDPFKDSITSTDETTEEIATDDVNTTSMPETIKNVIPVWMYIVTVMCIVVTLTVLLLLACYLRQNRTIRFVQNTSPNQKVEIEHGHMNVMAFGQSTSDMDDGSTKTSNSPTSSPARFSFKKAFEPDNRSMTSEISLPRSSSITAKDRAVYNMPGIDMSRIPSGPYSLTTTASHIETNEEETQHEIESSSSSSSSSTSSPSSNHAIESHLEYDITKVPITSATLSTDSVGVDQTNGTTTPYDKPDSVAFF